MQVANGNRKRKGEVLFIDGRKLGTLIRGSRKQKQMSSEEIQRIGAVYAQFRRKGIPDEVPGYCRVATTDEISRQRYALAPGRYVGSEAGDELDEAFEERYAKHAQNLSELFAESSRTQKHILNLLGAVVRAE